MRKEIRSSQFSALFTKLIHIYKHNVNQSQIEISPNSAILTKRLKILILVKKLLVHCNDPVIHEQRFLKLPLNLSAIRCLFLQCQSISDWNFTEFRDTHKAAENFNLCEETSRSLQWSCYSWTKIFETSLELICDQVLVFLFWTARGVSIQPWSKLLGQQRNSWSKWGIFLLPSTPGVMLALCLQVSLNTINITVGRRGQQK